MIDSDRKNIELLENIKVRILKSKEKRDVKFRAYYTIRFDFYDSFQLRMAIEDRIKILKENIEIDKKYTRCCRCRMNECLKLYTTNRFGDKKEYCCRCYSKSNHKKEYNPTFDKLDWCAKCLPN